MTQFPRNLEYLETNLRIHRVEAKIKSKQIFQEDIHFTYGKFPESMERDNIRGQKAFRTLSMTAEQPLHTTLKGLKEQRNNTNAKRENGSYGEPNQNTIASQQNPGKPANTKQKYLQPELLYPAKLSFKIDKQGHFKKSTN